MYNSELGIIAGITLFNPDIDRLSNNLSSILSQCSEVVLVDNGSQNIANIEQLCCRLGSRIGLVKNNENEGVAHALNQMLNVATSRGFTEILFLDQDSVASPNMVAKLVKNCAEDVAVVAAKIIDRNRELNNIEWEENNSEAVECYWPITSGSLTNVRLCNELGGFSEALFIDFVDDEFSIRVRRAGYRMLEVSDAFLYHEIGKLKPVGIPFPHIENGKVTIRRAFESGHPSIRHYYQVRNLIAIRRVYGAFCKSLGTPLPSAAKFIAHLLIVEPDRRRNIQALFQALRDAPDVARSLIQEQLQ